MIELALIFGSGALCLAFAGYLARWVLARPPGEDDVVRVAQQIQAAAHAFFARQSGTIAAVSAVLGGAIFLVYGLLRRPDTPGAVSPLELGVWLTFSFALGTAGSVGAGRVATWITTRTAPRVASGARRSLDHALQIAIRGGAVSGLFLSALGMVALGALFASIFAYEGGFGDSPAAALERAPHIPLQMVGFPLGASFAALLAQLGAGSFAKAADVSADLAGQEAGLGADDPQNPGTLADLAGDCVGDAGARAAGLFQSSVAESLGAMIIAGVVFRHSEGLPSAVALVLFPLVVRVFGILGNAFAVMVVRTDDREDPMNALARGLYVSSLLQAVGLAGASKWLLGSHWIALSICGGIGVLAAVLVFHVTQYFTEARFRPVRELSEAARGGPTAVLVRGGVLGLESAMVHLALVAAALLGSYAVGASTGLVGGGLLGTAMATVGMLGAAGYVLAMGAFGPIVDAAGGIAAMTLGRERPDVLGRLLVLDGVGSTAKSLTRAYAATTAGLASLLFVGGFADEARRRAGLAVELPALPVDLGRVEILLGGVVGVLLVLWLSAEATSRCARLARRLLDELRRELRDRPPGYVPPHDRYVEVASRAAVRLMIGPALVLAAIPVVLGLALRLGRTEDTPLITADSVTALALAATVVGVLGALLAGNAGGAWDNGKKYIATGAHGGRHLVDAAGGRAENPTFVAAVIGDTVGDALKGVTGPALHVLVKMLPAMILVFLPFFV